MSLKDSLKDKAHHSVLIVDDLVDNVFILKTLLEAQGYKTFGAHTGNEAIEEAKKHQPDLVLLDLGLPDINGVEVLQEIRRDDALINTGIIIVTAASSSDDLIKAFQLGADDFIKKPYHHLEMLARMQSTLKLRDTYAQLRSVNTQLDMLNKGLEFTVKEQVKELEKTNRLKHFMAPQVVESFLDQENQDIRRSIRREVSVIFLDLRGFTAFADAADPEHLMQILQNFHNLVGPIIFKHQATIERFTGDGLMCIVGAPNKIENHADIAVQMSQEIQQVYSDEKGKNDGSLPLDMAIGISSGLATTGTIGFEGRLDYAAIGPVTNMAARLCALAEANQILLSDRTEEKISHSDTIEYVGEGQLKGFARPGKY